VALAVCDCLLPDAGDLYAQPAASHLGLYDIMQAKRQAE
jgi:hypothetical protein